MISRCADRVKRRLSVPSLRIGTRPASIQPPDQTPQGTHETRSIRLKAKFADQDVSQSWTYYGNQSVVVVGVLYYKPLKPTVYLSI